MRVLHAGERARLLLADAQAEVYVSYEAEGDVERDILGCAYGQRRPYRVGYAFSGSGSGGGGDRPHVLGGTTVAGESSSYCNICFRQSEEQSHSVWSIDLTTGRLLHRAPSPAYAQSIVVKPDGAIAWIAATGLDGVTGFHDEWVYAVDRGGVRLLAHGNDIDESSLALGVSTIYWTEGGQPHSAALN